MCIRDRRELSGRSAEQLTLRTVGRRYPRRVTRSRMRRSIRSKPPGLDVERELWNVGACVVAGVDEVGRGSWAGPLTVAVAVIPKDRRVYRVRDSKMLSEAERERLFDRIADWCEAWGVGHASPEECDRLGMSGAQRLAAHRALDGLD